MTLPKKPSLNVNRHPQGVPAGGQFAAAPHSEPEVTLASEGGFFSESDNDPNILANAPTTDGDTGDEPTHGLTGGDGGGDPPPGPGGGSGGDGDDEQRKASQKLISNAAKTLFSTLQNARTISVSAKENGYLRVDDVADHRGGSIDGAVTSLNMQINSNTPRGLGLPAEHILGKDRSASIDAAALIRGEIRKTGLGKLL